MNLCFDFDGPIIDVTDRYYRAYLESLIDTEVNKNEILTKEDFWKLKQNRISELEIGIMSGLPISKAVHSANTRKELTFKNEYFLQDKLFDDVVKVFEHLNSLNIVFCIVTLRRKRQLLQAVKQFKLDKYLDRERFFSIPDDEKITNDVREKHLLLVNAVNKLGLYLQDTWIIGDSETDIHAGRLAKYGKVIGITRGVRSKEQLEILRPDYVINSLSEIIDLIK